MHHLLVKALQLRVMAQFQAPIKLNLESLSASTRGFDSQPPAESREGQVIGSGSS